jgi:hypothetical protein
MSVNVHLGIEPARRDDLVSIGYVLLYLIRGSLPWQGISGFTKQETNALILKEKARVSFEYFCKMYDLPDEIVTYMKYVKALRFDDKPDYAYLRELLKDCFGRKGFVRDYVYDWTPTKSSVDEGSVNETDEIAKRVGDMLLQDKSADNKQPI